MAFFIARLLADRWHRTTRAESAALPPGCPRWLATSIFAPTMAELAWSLRHTVAVHGRVSHFPGVVRVSHRKGKVSSESAEC